MAAPTGNIGTERSTKLTVGDTNRSADWIELRYQNQKANQTW